MYPRPVRMPANTGDSVDFPAVTCTFCGTQTTVAIERVRVGAVYQARANVPVCCDRVRSIHAEIEKQLSA